MSLFHIKFIASNCDLTEECKTLFSNDVNFFQAELNFFKSGDKGTEKIGVNNEDFVESYIIVRRKKENGSERLTFHS